MKAKSAVVVQTPRIVVTSSGISDIEQASTPTREQRKREASEPLYLVRYE